MSHLTFKIKKKKFTSKREITNSTKTIFSKQKFPNKKKWGKGFFVTYYRVVPMHWTTGLLLNPIGFGALSSATARPIKHVWFWWGWEAGDKCGGKDVIICFYWAQNGGGWINEGESLRLFECLMIFDDDYEHKLCFGLLDFFFLFVRENQSQILR